MAMVVKNNMSAVSTLNTLNKNSSALQKSLQKVSSGMKINSAQDDASGYAISEKMRVQIRSLDQANQNTQNASSMMKTAEGAVSSTVEILKSLKEKAINAATDTNTDSDRVTIQKEIDQFIDQIDDNALTTFNGKYMVDGSKQQEGQATYTAMTNQSLDKATDGSTKLIDLKNRNSDSLEIESTDYVTASFVMNGKTYTTKFSVGSETKLEDVFNNLNAEYKEKNAGTTESATAVFGAANTDTTPAMTTDTAKAILNSASADDIFKAAANSTDTSAATAAVDENSSAVKIADIATAVKTLANENKLSEVSNSAFETDASVAKVALETDIATAYTALETAVTSVGGLLNGSSTSHPSVSAGDKASITLTSTQVTDTSGTTATADLATITLTVIDDQTHTGSAAVALTSSPKFAMDTDSGTYIATAMKSADNKVAQMIAAGALTSGDVDTAIKTATTTTAVASGDATTNTDILTDAAIAAQTGATTTDGDKYATSKAFEKLLPTGGDAEVLSSTNIGINTAGDMVKTADGEVGLTVTAAKNSIQRQVSGVTISITDSEGQVKKSANAALDQFNTTIYAKNASDRNELTFQVGAAANQSITVGLDDMRAEALGLKSSDGTKVSVATQDNANAAVKVFDNAIQKALDQQTTIGAVEARLEYTSNNLTTSSENVQAAESTIRDADMAKEMTAYTKNNVLLQAAQSMLAQANQSSSQVLSLLQ